MKAIVSCFIALLFAFHASGKERTYAASTPADPFVKIFLGIPLSDSVEYIRWNIILGDKEYTLHCSYKIAGNNINEPGKIVRLKGLLSHEKNYYILHNNDKIMKLAELNADLLHVLNTDNSLLVGNGGWSYTINNIKPLKSENIFIKARPIVIKDSMVFIGRSPCSVPGIVPKGTHCYKLKWKIVFYGNRDKNGLTTCKIYGTPYRKEGVKKATWKMITENDGRILYQLYDESGKPFLYLEKADENILLFTDATGKLLTGDEDYSFTLNRKL